MASCLSSTAYREYTFRQSCVWRQYRDSSLIETQELKTIEGNIFIPGITYGKTFCGMKFNVNLPSAAEGRWGAAFRVQGMYTNTYIRLGFRV